MTKGTGPDFEGRLHRRAGATQGAGSVRIQDESLLSGAVGAPVPSAPEDAGPAADVVTMQIPVDLINVREGFNARKTGLDDIGGLAASIREHGQHTAIAVMESSEPEAYDLLTGERRLRAIRQLGWPTIRAEVHRRYDALEQTMLMLTENEQREDVDPLELGIKYKEVLAAFPEMKPYHIAQRLGVRAPLVYARLRLVDVPALHPLLDEKTISISVAEELQRLFTRDGTPRKEGILEEYMAWYVHASPTVKELHQTITRTLESNFTYIPGQRMPPAEPTVRSPYPRIARQAEVVAKRMPQLNTLELTQMKTLYQSLLSDVDQEIQRRLTMANVAATVEGDVSPTSDSPTTSGSTGPS